MEYSIKQISADSKRAMKEYRERAFYKKFYVLGRIRQKGEEKPVSISCFMATIGATFLTAQALT